MARAEFSCLYNLKIECQILAWRNFSDCWSFYLKTYYIQVGCIVSNVLLALLDFRELKSLANNAKIRSSLNFHLIRYMMHNLMHWKSKLISSSLCYASKDFLLCVSNKRNKIQGGEGSSKLHLINIVNGGNGPTWVGL